MSESSKHKFDSGQRVNIARLKHASIPCPMRPKIPAEGGRLQLYRGIIGLHRPRYAVGSKEREGKEEIITCVLRTNEERPSQDVNGCRPAKDDSPSPRLELFLSHIEEEETVLETTFLWWFEKFVAPLRLDL